MSSETKPKANTARVQWLEHEVNVLREVLRRVSPLHERMPLKMLAEHYGITPPSVTS